VLPKAKWQRCYVHFLRNALDHLPRKKDDDVLTELRWTYERRNVEEARRDLAAWLTKWETRYPKLSDWAEGNIEETLTFHRLPQEHHQHLKSTSVLERVNQELKRRALAVEIHEDWVEAIRFMNIEVLKEQLTEQRRELAPAARGRGKGRPGGSCWRCRRGAGRPKSFDPGLRNALNTRQKPLRRAPLRPGATIGGSVRLDRHHVSLSTRHQ